MVNLMQRIMKFAEETITQNEDSSLTAACSKMKEAVEKNNIADVKELLQQAGTDSAKDLLVELKSAKIHKKEPDNNASEYEDNSTDMDRKFSETKKEPDVSGAPNLQLSSGDIHEIGKLDRLDVQLIPIERITIDPEFEKLFDRNPILVEELSKNIEANGLRQDKPITVWLNQNGELVLVDGHTRLAATRSAGKKEVYAVIWAFKDRTLALDFAFNEQALRRNLTNGQKLPLIQRLLKSEQEAARKRQEGSAPNDADSGKTAEVIARKLCMGTTTVERAIAVLKSGDEKLIRQVETDALSISAAAKKLKPNAALKEESSVTEQESTSGSSASEMKEAPEVKEKTEVQKGSVEAGGTEKVSEVSNGENCETPPTALTPDQDSVLKKLVTMFHQKHSELFNQIVENFNPKEQILIKDVINKNTEKVA